MFMLLLYTLYLISHIICYCAGGLGMFSVDQHPAEELYYMSYLLSPLSVPVSSLLSL